MFLNFAPDRITVSNIGLSYKDLPITIRPSSASSRKPTLFLGEDQIALIPTQTPFDDLSSGQLIELFGRVAPALEHDI